MKTIKKGQKFLCIKDYVMRRNNEIAYKEGKEYTSLEDDSLKSEINDKHWMTRNEAFKECFKRIKYEKVKKRFESHIQNIPVIFETVKVDSVVESVIKKFKDRSNVGIKKYGTTLDRKDINFDGWAEHLQQELMDGILYLERLKKEFDGK